MLDEGGSSLPAAALYPAIALGLVALVYALTRTPHLTGRFLIASIWLRYVMQVFYQQTHPPMFGGFSLNALVSLVVCALGLLVVQNRLRVVTRFPITLALMLVVAISGILNGANSGMFETLLKWAYFFIVALCVYDCIRKDGDARIFTALLWVFATPLLLQALSILTGSGKASEADGSVSFIGGFSHEAAFSMVLLTCFAIASFAPRVHPGIRTALLTACVIGIFAANYRTSLIAFAPLAIGYLTFNTARSFTSRQRLLVSATTLLASLGVTVLAAWLLRERMADIAAAAGSDAIFKQPTEFTQAERDLFSGRLYLWSSYVNAYLAGNDLQILFGFGPDSWIGVFSKYAHNTLISYLYEFGAFGAVLIAMVWTAMLARAATISDPWLRGQVVCAHIGFIILNFATMPFWQIEGVILYALLCGYTMALTSRQGVRAPSPIDWPRAYATAPRLAHWTRTRGGA